jgi:inorganic pyrophosphatase
MANYAALEYDVTIEIPRGSKVKYEYDTTSGRLRVDRILTTAYTYPYNYGYIPGTLSEDGDPVDIMVLGEHAFLPGCVVRCRVVGGLITYDGTMDDVVLKADPKIIMVPIGNIDRSVGGLEEVPKVSQAIIEDFFRNYKNNEPTKKVRIGEWMGAEEAIDHINYIDEWVDDARVS